MISWDPTEFTARATASFNLCQQDGEMASDIYGGLSPTTFLCKEINLEL